MGKTILAAEQAGRMLEKAGPMRGKSSNPIWQSTEGPSEWLRPWPDEGKLWIKIAACGQ
jgi:hypothetical protein